MKTATKKPVTELTAGDQINPPSHERRWLWKDGVKRQLTVIRVYRTCDDKRGAWWVVEASYTSPYGPNETTSRFKMRPEKMVKVNGKA